MFIKKLFNACPGLIDAFIKPPSKSTNIFIEKRVKAELIFVCKSVRN